ncbi:MAG TPA: hypothetical protein VNI84_21105 [Pyrinomonadaceae bacterium]|nr:hypothetical protein [Pyrinomonadaceae bacterium]
MSARFIQKTPILKQGNLDRVLSRVLREGLKELKSEVQRWQLDTPHTGRMVKRRGRIHVASRIGESPAPDTMNLVNSARIIVDSPTRGRVVINAHYAVILQNRMNRDITITPSRNYAPKFKAKVADGIGELL